MLRQRHPETGAARRQARESLFVLLVATVLLATALEVLVNHLGGAQDRGPLWWVGLGVLVVIILGLLYAGIWWDDRWIGQTEARIELLLPYVVSDQGREVQLGSRRSYRVTGEARAAWAAAFPQGLALAGREGSLAHRLLPEHMALVRYLLAIHLARFGRHGRPGAAVHGWLRLGIPHEARQWGSLPGPVRDAPFAQAVGEACPQTVFLPRGMEVEAFDQGPLLLRLRWRPARRRWLCWLLGIGGWSPGGEVRVRWLGPLSEAPSHDKRWEHLTARLRDLPTTTEARVVVTRLVVEVASRWNALEEVARFRDWGINLALYLQEQMDYWSWRAYYLERVVDDLDWKIGWIEKGEEPGLAKRLRRLDGRLARLEAHLWPDEPPEGGGEGVWLSGEGNDVSADGVEG